MATVKAVFDFLDGLAAFETQMDFDNAGFLVGRGDKTVTRLLVSLDITEAVARGAAQQGAQLAVMGSNRLQTPVIPPPPLLWPAP